ncbi:helix-turn-helix transcriptional regulator [Nocardioides caricicola]|uniref:LuxR C-terminal-related transcriptional regulator n=1 Tax=Nocardioides caricicola TaxID=634770 RepID=A0ABW0MT94_9ACTN
MPTQCHVAVAADQSLIADTVSAALVTPGMRVTGVRWRTEPAPWVPVPRVEDPIDVGVMLCDLQPRWRLVQARWMIHSVRAPWLVLTGAPRGPLWGAMLDAGAVAVYPSASTLNEVRLMVGRVVAGESLMDAGEMAALRAAWHTAERARLTAVRSVRSLSPREFLVLELMHAGEPVQGIAAQLDVSESTVRSHVRAVLRKLDVRTQLAAVAEFEAASAGIDGDADGDADDWPGGS